MDSIWKIKLKKEHQDIRTVEDVCMRLIKDFRAIPASQPYRIVVARCGIGTAVCERLAGAGLPAVLQKIK